MLASHERPSEGSAGELTKIAESTLWFIRDLNFKNPRLMDGLGWGRSSVPRTLTAIARRAIKLTYAMVTSPPNMESITGFVEVVRKEV
jgi:hypothetical protein